MLRTVSQWVMYMGMAIGMAGGATWPRPSWAIVGGGLGVIVVGIVLRKLAGAPPIEEHAAPSDGADRPALIEKGATLDAAVAKMAELVGDLGKEAEGMDLEAAKLRITDLIRLGPERLGAAQEAIAARVGFPTYAEVMAPLATSERLLYRAWSAAADGHRPEMVASIQAAHPFAEEAAQLAKEKLAGKLA